MILRNPLLHHPYYRPSVSLARGSVNLATMIWSAIVIWKPYALLSSGASYAWITNYLSEDALAWALGLMALMQMIWLMLCLPPLRFGSIGYMILAFAWLFVWFAILTGPTVQPTSAACVPVIAALAFYGFISNPREPNDRGGLAP